MVLGVQVWTCRSAILMCNAALISSRGILEEEVGRHRNIAVAAEVVVAEAAEQR